jgi:excisionase family DNA binding protein
MAKPVLADVALARDLSCAEAAALLGISKSTLYERAAAGRVPHHRYGGRVTFSVAHIEAIRRAAEHVPQPLLAVRRGRRVS